MCPMESKFSLCESLAKAINRGDVERTQDLVKAGADVNCRSADGYPVLWFANTEDVLKLLLSHGGDINIRHFNGRTLLHSCAGDDTKLAKHLLRYGADPNGRCDQGETPIFSANNSKFSEGVELLLANGADINAQRNDGCTVLHCAIMSDGHIAKLLIERGANLELAEEIGDTPLITAVKVPDMSEIDLVSLLLERGANPNAAKKQDGRTAMHYAAFLGQTEIVQKLVNFGANINALNFDNKTPLDMAVECEKFLTAKLIAELGGKRNKSNIA